ncbi:unnamed product [Ostreococcus tauri]|uniref:Unnamed product n=1 Tax=Ostreococcus tauri TaxID=70448 RepID=A0A090N3F3_OSTTA|nr:unnamed product [Ostreococcus tauri]CEF98018.1 unnamed product [Ostreococcus tauri]|eukprot:XP_003079394.2 unnamed product [Ostreococcus tauri]
MFKRLASARGSKDRVVHFTVTVHALEPWIGVGVTGVASERIALGWERGANRRGTTSVSDPTPLDDYGRASRYTFEEEIAIDATVQKGRVKALRFFVLAIPSGTALGGAVETRVVGGCDVDLAKFTDANDGRGVTLEVGCGDDVRAAVGAPRLTITVRARVADGNMEIEPHTPEVNRGRVAAQSWAASGRFRDEESVSDQSTEQAAAFTKAASMFKKREPKHEESSAIEAPRALNIENEPQMSASGNEIVPAVPVTTATRESAPSGEPDGDPELESARLELFGVREAQSPVTPTPKGDVDSDGFLLDSDLESDGEDDEHIIMEFTPTPLKDKATEDFERAAEEEALRVEAERVAAEEARMQVEEDAAVARIEAERLALEEEERKRIEEARLATIRIEEERLRLEEEERLARVEFERAQAEEEARRLAEEDAIAAALEEEKVRAEEERQWEIEAAVAAARVDELERQAELARMAEEDAVRKAEEEARLRAEEDAVRKAEEEARLRAEEDAVRKAEEEARLRAEEDAVRKAEEEARLRAEEEARHRDEEEARLRASAAEEEVMRAAEQAAAQEAAAAAQAALVEQERVRAEEALCAAREAEELLRLEEEETLRVAQLEARLQEERELEARLQEERELQAAESVRTASMPDVDVYAEEPIPEDAAEVLFSGSPSAQSVGFSTPMAHCDDAFYTPGTHRTRFADSVAKPTRNRELEDEVISMSLCDILIHSAAMDSGFTTALGLSERIASVRSTQGLEGSQLEFRRIMDSFGVAIKGALSNPSRSVFLATQLIALRVCLANMDDIDTRDLIELEIVARNSAFETLWTQTFGSLLAPSDATLKLLGLSSLPNGDGERIGRAWAVMFQFAKVRLGVDLVTNARGTPNGAKPLTQQLQREILKNLMLRLDKSVLDVLLKPTEDEKVNAMLPGRGALTFATGAELKRAISALVGIVTELNLGTGPDSVTPKLRAAADVCMIPKDALTDPQLRADILCGKLSGEELSGIVIRFRPDDFAPQPVDQSVINAVVAAAASEHTEFDPSGVEPCVPVSTQDAPWVANLASALAASDGSTVDVAMLPGFSAHASRWSLVAESLAR